MPLPKDYLSPSQIRQYLRCPQCYRFRYVDGLVAPISPTMLRGRAVHRGIEQNYIQKRDTHEDLPVEQVREVTAGAFEEDREDVDWSKDDPGKALDSTVAMAELYHTEVAPTIQPASVEERVEIAFPGLDYELVGVIDVVDEHGYIRDTKTTGKTPAENVIHNNLQLCAYALMYRTITEEQEAGIVLDYLVATKTPKVVRFEKQVEEEEIDRFLRIMQAVADAIDKGIFLPADGCFMCGKPGSPYWDANMAAW